VDWELRRNGDVLLCVVLEEEGIQWAWFLLVSKIESIEAKPALEPSAA
jgi:hypothetical protein